MENKKEKDDDYSNDILNQEFFDTIKLSKKINSKTKKLNEITEWFKKTPNYNELPQIKNKMQDLLSLLLTNLNENNNNYVLSQMELIKTLGHTINNEENYRNFIKLSLPKLFDKFYLGNPKINDSLIEMFDEFISFKILSIKDYYQYIDNIPFEEEDNYRLNLINFLHEQINKDESVLLNNIPKSINELIKKLVNDNDSEISETASKILNILINRDIESNKKKDQDKNDEKKNQEDINNNNSNENKNDSNNNENKGNISTSNFVKNIITAIKKEGDNEVKNIENKEEKKEQIDNNNDKKENEKPNEEKKVNEDKNINENTSKENILQETKNEEENKKIEIKDDDNNKEDKPQEIEKKEEKPEDKKENIEEKKQENNAENIEVKKDDKTNDKLEQTDGDNNEVKVEVKKELEEKKEERKEEKVEEEKEKKNVKAEEKQEEKKNDNIGGEKKEEKVEEKKIEEKKEDKLEEKKEEKKEENKIEEKKEDKIEEKKEEKSEPKSEEKKLEKEIENKNEKNTEEIKSPEKKEDNNKEVQKDIEIKEIKTEEPKQKEDKPLEEIKSEIKDNIVQETTDVEQNKIEEKKEDNPKEKEKIQEIKNEEKKEGKNDIAIKGSSGENKINDKKEDETKQKKGGVKRTGIKSQISKFRKNLKNKKKDPFEFELVEKKKEGNTETNEKKAEEKGKEKEINNNEIKEMPKQEIKTENKETIPEKKENPIKSEEPPAKKDEPKNEKKEIITGETPKEETIEEEKVEAPKEIKKEEVKEETPQEAKKEDVKEEIKIETPKEEIKEEKKEEEKPNLEQELTLKKSIKIVAGNQQSLNEFEKKLQLALEQEEKEGILNKNNENLTDNNPQPIKQKKEDPKFDEIKSALGKEIVDSLFSPKWEVKKHGYELINEFINNKPQNSYNLNDLIEYMKLKLKNYKETNFNLNREAINIYINMIKKKIITKDLLTPIIIAYHEKLADIKLKDNLVELINNSFDIIEPSNILKQIISKISKKNNAKLLIEYSTFLGNVVEDYDVKDLPNKEIIDFCKVLANNSNPQVRTSAISLLCILYKYLGKDVKTLTRDIKESTLKLIDAELDKVKVIDPKESAGKKKKVASTGGGESKSGPGGGGDLIPPQDISKKITAKMIKDLNGKWAEKKEACESIEKVLTAANMRILPNGLNNLMTTFKKKLSDSNKNFVKMIVALLSKFIEALKQGFKQWAKPIALALIPNLADKNQLMRNECQNCFDKWVEFTGFDSLVVHLPQFLKTDNVEMRIEILNFFTKYKDKFNKSIGDLVYKDMMNPLLICLQDRSSNVRNAAEEIIKSSLNFISINNYYKKSEDFKPAIAKTLKQILDKIKNESSNSTENPEQENNQNQQPQNIESNIINNNNQNENNININNNKKLITQNQKKNEEITNEQKPGSRTASKKNSIQLSDTPVTTESGNSEKNAEDPLNNYNTVSNFSKTMKKPEKDAGKPKTNTSKINVKRATKPKRKLSEDDLVNPLGTAMNKQMPVSSVAHLASNSTILKKNEKKSFQKNISQTIKTSAVFLMNIKVIPNKGKRFDKDKRTKFNLETVNKDYFNKLKDQCKGLFVEDFSKKIFSDDFRKQVEAFKEMKSQIDKKINVPIYFDNLDLILKIIGIKIMNNLNPTLMKNFFEFLDSLYLILAENKYKLNETETSIIINILIDKLSLNNNTLREHLFSLLNQYLELMDVNKIMVTVINVALNKNNKIKTDVLDLIIDLTANQKLNIVNKTYAKLLCRFLPIYDNVIKTKTLSLFQEIYSNIGNELWNIIEISEKDKEYLQENLNMDNDEEEEGEEEEDEDEEIGQIINNEENGNNINEENANNINENKNNNQNRAGKVEINNNSIENNGSLTKEDLLDALDNLLSEDQNEKVNTIIIIHEIVCGKFVQNKKCLISNVDKIISKFRIVSNQIFFVNDVKTIPIKFAKYLTIVLCKLASNKELISNLSYEVLLDLSRDLLKYLLIVGLDKIGENQEGNIIFKSINSTMLRILENCDNTLVLTALLELIKESHEKGDKHLISLAAKCLLKAAQNLPENINNIKIDRILLQIHLLLLSLQKNDQDISKVHNNTLIVNTIKTIVGDFVKLKKEKILEDYSKSVKNHQMNDRFLLKWIKSALEKV